MPKEWRTTSIPVRVGRKRSGIPNIHLDSGSTCTRRGAQWSSSRGTQADDVKARNDVWSTDHLYRYHREFGGSQTLRARTKGRSQHHPNTCGCCQTDKHVIGCVAGKSHRRLMVAGRHRGRGLVSLRSQYRAGSLQNVTRGPGRDSQQFKQHPGPITYGQKDGQVCRKSAQQKEKQRWTGEKSKLDNARGLRGIWYMDPDDMEVQDIMKNELKSPLESAMLRRTVTKHGKTCCAKFQ